MVRAHQGTVTAESAGDGQGAAFTVRLPLLLTTQVTNRDAAESSRDQPVALAKLGLDMLVVDDERDAREMLGLMLEANGATVRSVGSAQEAFEAMTERRPDVLLADLGMAVEDGYSLIRRWRMREKDMQSQAIAAIAVTAYASHGDRERALSGGYDAHIAKPVDANELMRVIAAVMTPVKANRN
jgi:CheY-like chemotaxis protein